MGNKASIPDLPHTDLANDVLELLDMKMPEHLFNHSIRSYLFSVLIARTMELEPGRDYDDEVTFCICLMHDVGLTDDACGDQRFEVDGADYAVEFLTKRGMSPERAELVWDGIALHTSAGIANRKPKIAVASYGIGADVLGIGCEHVDSADAAAVHELYPRLGMCDKAPLMIVTQCEANPEKAPLYSAGACLAHDLGSTLQPPTWQMLQAVHPWRDVP